MDFEAKPWRKSQRKFERRERELVERERERIDERERKREKREGPLGFGLYLKFTNLPAKIFQQQFAKKTKNGRKHSITFGGGRRTCLSLIGQILPLGEWANQCLSHWFLSDGADYVAKDIDIRYGFLVFLTFLIFKLF